MKVAIIDDGISYTFLDDYNYYIDHNLKLNKYKDIHQMVSHGDKCFNIINAVKNRNIEFISIKAIKPSTLTGDLIYFASALEACYTYIKLDIVNISLGTTERKDFKRICPLLDKLSKLSIIVATVSNEGAYTLLAHYKNVIGVKKNLNLNENSYYCNDKQNRMFELGTKLKGNSFAAALMTKKIIEIMGDDKYGFNEVFHIFSTLRN